MEARQILNNFLFILLVTTFVGLFFLFMKKGFENFFNAIEFLSDFISLRIEKFAKKT